MADLTSTAAQVRRVAADRDEVYDYIAGAAITAGQAIYIDSNGKAQLADASVSGTAGCRGVALKTVAAGQPVPVIKRGLIGGFTISQAYDAVIYLSDTTGALADAAGTVSTTVGRVVPVNSGSVSKMLYIDIKY